MSIKKYTLFIFSLGILYSCQTQSKLISVQVTNDLNLERKFETVELTKEMLQVTDLTKLGVKEATTGKVLVSQLVDVDGDKVMDQLLFQPTVEANSSKKYMVFEVSKKQQPESTEYCYSRFVPERTDDYTWENDKVAFRVYGPVAQKMIEDKIPGGTLSSGVDAWLKKVSYPVINKWYKKTTEGTGSYHQDTGEGLDNFHVGISRGVGGIAVKVDSTYYFSKNYITWKTITTGPIRTSFYLEYANWNADGKLIKESKTISLDYGNNLSKFSTNIQGSNEISAGLTLHEKDGSVTGNTQQGWLSYWQPHAKSELGTAIVAQSNYFKGYETYSTKTKDLSNAYAHLNVIEGKVEYYAGFGWKEAGEFTSAEKWRNYLQIFSKKINSPLKVSVIKNN